jgi:FtsP/CotA-like multicopper oxidase with cupredoxin domain
MARLLAATRLLVMTALGAVALALHGSAAAAQDACVPTRFLTIYAQKVGSGLAYGLTPSTASIPGPTLILQEGECLAVTLVNNTTGKVSVHPHGVDYTVSSDGTSLNNSCTKPGESRTYVMGAHAPHSRPDGTLDPGSAGYWHYHDHCRGDHGTNGIDAGLFGAIIVRRPGDPEPARPPFVVVMIGRTINLKTAPDTPLFEANVGERVEFVVLGHGNLFHTFHLHGHRWLDTRTGASSTPGTLVPVIDNRTVGPADSFGFQVIAGEGVGPGAWMYHCHVQEHADAGMSGIFLVHGPDGQTTPSALAALTGWRQLEAAHHAPAAAAGH